MWKLEWFRNWDGLVAPLGILLGWAPSANLLKVLVDLLLLSQGRHLPRQQNRNTKRASYRARD